jgi:hypothetical protein
MSCLPPQILRVALLLGLAGMDGEAAMPGSPLQAWAGSLGCNAFKDGLALWQYCLYHNVHALRTVEQQREICGRTGQWASACTEEWVRAVGMPSLSWEVLMEVCGADDDCRFEVVDAQSGTVWERLGRCMSWAGIYEDDCSRHALTTWWTREGSVRELAQVGRLALEPYDTIGEIMAFQAACRHTTTCDASPDAARYCEAKLTAYSSEPGKCLREPPWMAQVFSDDPVRSEAGR